MATMPASDMTKFKGASDAPVPHIIDRKITNVSSPEGLVEFTYNYTTDGAVPGYAPTLVEVTQDPIDYLVGGNRYMKIQGPMTQLFHFEEDHRIECLEPKPTITAEDIGNVISDAIAENDAAAAVEFVDDKSVDDPWEDIMPIQASAIPPPIGTMNMPDIMEAFGVPSSIVNREKPEKPKMKPVPEKRGRRILLE